jgi:hypothetical protein
VHHSLIHYDNLKFRKDCTDLAISLQDAIKDYSAAIKVLRENQMTKLLLQIINAEGQMSEKNRLLWLINSFEYMIKLELMDMAVDLFEKYTQAFYVEKGHYMEYLGESIIVCFDKSPTLLELKIFILAKWLPLLDYSQVDRLL